MSNVVALPGSTDALDIARVARELDEQHADLLRIAEEWGIRPGHSEARFVTAMIQTQKKFTESNLAGLTDLHRLMANARLLAEAWEQARDALAATLVARRAALLRRICALRATTLPGHAARAATLVGLDASVCTPAADDTWFNHLIGAIVRDLAGRADRSGVARTGGFNRTGRPGDPGIGAAQPRGGGQGLHYRKRQVQGGLVHHCGERRQPAALLPKRVAGRARYGSQGAPAPP